MNKLFLLVDDDSDDAELFGEALATIDPPVEFHHAQDGKVAFDYLGNSKNKIPDLIFLDLNMPEMSGWQCLTRIKKDDSLKNTSVVMYSTSSHQRDKDLAIELGALGFITKPADYKKLRDILKRVASASNPELKNVIQEI